MMSKVKPMMMIRKKPVWIGSVFVKAAVKVNIKESGERKS